MPEIKKKMKSEAARTEHCCCAVLEADVAGGVEDVLAEPVAADGGLLVYDQGGGEPDAGGNGVRAADCREADRQWDQGPAQELGLSGSNAVRGQWSPWLVHLVFLQRLVLVGQVCVELVQPRPEHAEQKPLWRLRRCCYRGEDGLQGEG